LLKEGSSAHFIGFYPSGGCVKVGILLPVFLPTSVFDKWGGLPDAAVNTEKMAKFEECAIAHKDHPSSIKLPKG
jgi:hypothetical protein